MVGTCGCTHWVECSGDIFTWRVSSCKKTVNLVGESGTNCPSHDNRCRRLSAPLPSEGGGGQKGG